MKKTPFFILLTALLFLSLSPQKSYAASWWSAAFPQTPEKQTLFLDSAKQLHALLNIKEDATFHEKTDAARLLVQNNSIHKIDKEFYSYWGNIPLLMQLILFNASQTIDDKPHMECASRTAVLYHLLKTMNIRARPVVVYTGNDIQNSHTYLEVYNPQTEQWEIQDPDKNMYWKFRETGARASTKDLMTHPVKETFLPCHTPEDCAYNPKNEQKIIALFSLAALIDFEAGRNPLLANPDRFDMDHPFLKKENPMAYCTLFPQGACHSEIIETGIAE